MSTLTTVLEVGTLLLVIDSLLGTFTEGEGVANIEVNTEGLPGRKLPTEGEAGLRE